MYDLMGCVRLVVMVVQFITQTFCVSVEIFTIIRLYEV